MGRDVLERIPALNNLGAAWISRHMIQHIHTYGQFKVAN